MKKKLLKILDNKKIKIFFLSLLLMVTIVGAGSTIAYFTDVTNVLTNQFNVDNLHTHIEENVCKNSGTVILKQPVIVNDGNVTAFIRARITISPDFWEITNPSIKLELGNWSEVVDNSIYGKVIEDPGNFHLITQLEGVENVLYGKSNLGWFYKDGWYYYNQPVKAEGQTTTLFDAVKVFNVKENFDITIYQEAVASKSYILTENPIFDYEDITICIKNQGLVKDEYKGKSVIQAFLDVNKNNES